MCLLNISTHHDGYIIGLGHRHPFAASDLLAIPRTARYHAFPATGPPRALPCGLRGRYPNCDQTVGDDATASVGPNAHPETGLLFVTETQRSAAGAMAM